MSTVPTDVASAPRRSSRRRGRQQPSLPITAFRPPWIRHYIDVGHCRLQKCTNRIRTASEEEIKYLPISFLSMAIAASNAYGRKQESGLMEYARALISRGIDPDDISGGKSATASAAYHGYSDLLKLLLREGCSVTTGDFHPLFLAVKNGQYHCIPLLFEERQLEMRALLRKEATVYTGDSKVSTLGVALNRSDIEAVRLLRELGGAKCSDVDTCVFADGRKMQIVLQTLYPNQNVLHWSETFHWSFPATDRQMLNWLWYASQRHPQQSLPPEIWIRVFGFIGRGWWASQRFDNMTGAYNEVNTSNVVGWTGRESQDKTLFD